MGLFKRRLPTSITAHSRPISTATSAVTSYSASTDLPRHVRDRGLDHAVEREKHLRTVIDLKNLLKSEPTKSLPVSVISRQRDVLRIPTRPVEFLRRFPSVFAEFRPGNLPLDPHFKLTDEVLGLDEEEKLVYQSISYRKEVADRVLRLLMLGRKCEMPLGLVNYLGWDMGLPPDFSESIVPEFSDCFRVVNDRIGRGSGGGVLELVCWSGDLAKSAIERKVKKGGDSGRGEFEMQFSKGFETDKKMKKWFDKWQKLPYVSPYDSGCSLESKSEEAEKWGVGFLHELLHLFIPKKAEKDTALLVGEYFGIRSKFKRAMLCHPGIFYMSSKNRTHTVVLKEAYKRGSLVEMHPLMNVRNNYIHLMNTVKVDCKSVGLPSSTGQSGKVTNHQGKQREEDVDKIGEGAPRNSQSSSEVDDDDSDNVETVDESNDEEDARSRGVGWRGSRKAVLSRGRMSRNGHSSSVGQSRKLAEDKPIRKLYMQKFDKSSAGDSTRKESFKVSNVRERLPRRSATPRSGRSFAHEKSVRN